MLVLGHRAPFSKEKTTFLCHTLKLKSSCPIRNITALALGEAGTIQSPFPLQILYQSRRDLWIQHRSWQHCKSWNSNPQHPPCHSSLPAGTVNGKYCCPQLFVNHRCFSGPFLNKGRIAELPQSVGPGKCVLVLKEVRHLSELFSQELYIVFSCQRRCLIPWVDSV